MHAAAHAPGAPPRAVVVGSGPNGLAAAVAMARAGWDVLVFEAAGEIGGGTRSAELTLPGFVHDICSCVHPLGAGSPFFRTLGLERHGLEWVHPEVPLAHPFDDGTSAVLSRSIEATVQTLDAPDRGAYRRLLEPLASRWPALSREALAPLHVPRHPILLARFGLRALRSAAGLSRSAFDGPRARALFAGICAHALEPLERLPTAAVGLILAAAGHAVGWPFARGGSQRLAEALSAELRHHGGRIVTGRRIRRLEALPGARATFLDLTPRGVLEVAGETLPGRYRAALRRYRYGPGVFKVDWALSEPIPWRSEACARAGTIHLGGGLDEIAAATRAAWEGRRHERPFVLLAQPTLFDPSRAPAGRHTAWAYCHVPHGSETDEVEAIEDQVERFAPGFRDTVLARSTITAAGLERRNPNMVGGDINGGVQDWRQLFTRPVARPVPYATPVDGLYLCSSSTPPGGGVHGMCGAHAARAALRRLG